MLRVHRCGFSFILSCSDMLCTLLLAFASKLFNDAGRTRCAEISFDKLEICTNFFSEQKALSLKLHHAVYSVENVMRYCV